MPASNRKTIPTREFFSKMLQSTDLREFFQTHAGEMEIPPLHIHLSNICVSTGQVPEQVIKKAGIERTYGHQLFNGTRNPSRDKAIQLAFGLGLDPDGAQKLLQIARKNALYPRIKRDAAILYCFENRKSFPDAQCLLDSLGLTLLGEE